MPLRNIKKTQRALRLGKLHFMAPSPNPGAPSGFKDAQPPRGDEGCAIQPPRGRPADLYSFDTLTSDSGASLIDPLSTALDVVLTAEVWLSQLGSHETPSPMYLPRTQSGRT